MRAAALALLTLAACTGQDMDSTQRQLSCEVQSTVVSDPGSVVLDLLLVIDDSPAMAPHLETLWRNLPVFAAVLETIQGPLDLHVAVVSADPARGGALAGPVLEVRRRLHGIDTSFPGTLAEALSAQGTLGATGGAAKPLTALRLALGGANPAFLRKHAFLGVAVISAGDESSPEAFPFVAGLKGSPALVAGGVVAPPAAAGLAAFAAEMGPQGLFVDLDDDDWSDVLSPFARQLERLVGAPCLHGDVVTDPTVACSVSEGPWMGPEAVLPRCPGPHPCWTTIADPIRCAEPPHHLRLEIERDDYAPPGTITVVRCATTCR